GPPVRGENRVAQPECERLGWVVGAQVKALVVAPGLPGLVLGPVHLGRDQRVGPAHPGDDTGYCRRVARVWYAIAAILLVAGVAGTVLMVRRFPEDPRLVEVRFPGSYEATGTIAVTHAGPYAIWADGGPPVDANRCILKKPDGAAIT